MTVFFFVALRTTPLRSFWRVVSEWAVSSVSKYAATEGNEQAESVAQVALTQTLVALEDITPKF